MAYETGSYTDQYDLLAKIKTFLDVGGSDGTWTVDSYIADTQKYTSGSGVGQYRLHIHKTAIDTTIMYFNLKSSNAAKIWEYAYNYGEFSGIGLYGSTGYSGAGNWDKEPGYPYGSTTAKPCGVDIIVSGPGTYYFFSSADTVVIVIEYAGGKYQWLCFGQIQKLGSFTGGQFFTGSSVSVDHQDIYIPGGTNYGISDTPAKPFCASSYSAFQSSVMVHVNVDSYDTWRSYYYRANYNCATTKERLITSIISSGWNFSNVILMQLVLEYNLFQRSPNEFNGVAALFPIYFMAERSNSKWSPLGYVDIVRQVNMKYKSPLDEVVFGSDTWVFLPMHDSVNDKTTDVAFAVKKIV